MLYADGIIIGRTAGPEETALKMNVPDSREYGEILVDMLENGSDVAEVQDLADKWNQVMCLEPVESDLPTAIGKSTIYKTGSPYSVTAHVVLHQGSGELHVYPVKDKIGS